MALWIFDASEGKLVRYMVKRRKFYFSNASEDHASLACLSLSSSRVAPVIIGAAGMHDHENAIFVSTMGKRCLGTICTCLRCSVKDRKYSDLLKGGS